MLPHSPWDAIRRKFREVFLALLGSPDDPLHNKSNILKHICDTFYNNVVKPISKKKTPQ